MKRQRRDGTTVARQRTHILAIIRLKEMNRRIVAADCEQLVVGTERQRGDDIGCWRRRVRRQRREWGELGDLLAARRFPNEDLALMTADREQLAVRTERDRQQPIARTLQLQA